LLESIKKVWGVRNFFARIQNSAVLHVHKEGRMTNMHKYMTSANYVWTNGQTVVHMVELLKATH
jgi:hypothetical protein